MKILLALLLMASWASIRAQAGSLAGIVQDEQSAPIAGAQITIASESSQASFTSTSDARGAYRFESLPAGEYHLETAREGFSTSQRMAVSISVGAPATLPIVLKRLPSARPQFEAAGLRGLIDPGGYSATGNAAAASGLIKGVADIERTGNDATASTMNTSCALEPALKRDAEQRPSSAEASLKLGEFYLAHGQPSKALPALEHARSLHGNVDSNDQQTLVQLTDAYLKTGQFEAARQLLIAPDVHGGPVLYRLLARADEGTGRFAEASRAYQLAAEQEPREETLFGAGYELILAGLPRDAERAFAGAVEGFPRSIKLLIGLGSAQFLEGRTAESIRTFLRAVDVDPADSRAYPFLSAAASISHDEASQVNAAFARFLNLAPDSPRAAYYLALSMLHEPAADEVTGRSRIEALLKHAILMDPALPDAHFQFGVLYARQGNYQAAADELEKAIRLSPGLMEAHYRLAIAYRQTRRPDLSAQEMKRFSELQERSPAQKSGMAFDIEQFVSVLGKPDKVVAHETVCPGDSP